MSVPIQIRVRHRISPTRKNFLHRWKTVKERWLRLVAIVRSCIRPYIVIYIGWHALRKPLGNATPPKILIFQWSFVIAIEIRCINTYLKIFILCFFNLFDTCLISHNLWVKSYESHELWIKIDKFLNVIFRWVWTPRPLQRWTKCAVGHSKIVKMPRKRCQWPFWDFFG